MEGGSRSWMHTYWSLPGTFLLVYGSNPLPATPPLKRSPSAFSTCFILPPQRKFLFLLDQKVIEVFHVEKHPPKVSSCLHLLRPSGLPRRSSRRESNFICAFFFFFFFLQPWMWWPWPTGNDGKVRGGGEFSYMLHLIYLTKMEIHFSNGPNTFQALYNPTTRHTEMCNPASFEFWRFSSLTAV